MKTLFAVIIALSPVALHADDNTQRAYVEELVDALPEKVSWQLNDRKALIEKFNSLNAEVERKMSLDRRNNKYSQERHAELVKDVLWRYLINEQGKVVNPDTEIKEIAEAYAGIRQRPEGAAVASAATLETTATKLLVPAELQTAQNTNVEKLGDFDRKLRDLRKSGALSAIVAKEKGMIEHQKGIDILNGVVSSKELTKDLRDRLKSTIISEIANENGGRVDLPKESKLLEKIVNRMECKILNKPCPKPAKKTQSVAVTAPAALEETQQQETDGCNLSTAEKAFGFSGGKLEEALIEQYKESKQRIMNEEKDKNIRLVVFNYFVMNRNNMFLANPEDTKGPLVEIAECIKESGKKYEAYEAELDRQSQYRYNSNNNSRQEANSSAQ